MTMIKVTRLKGKQDNFFYTNPPTDQEINFNGGLQS